MEIPLRLFLEITTECNLRCQLCKLWQQKDPPNKLDLIQKIQFLESLFRWLEIFNPNFRDNFRVILTGGEPFLFPTQVFEIARFCRMNEVNCYINSSGLLLRPIMEMVPNSGLTAITISVDSHIDVLHDNLRGRRRIFREVINTIKLMLNQKRQENIPIKICIQSILGNWNIQTLPAHIEFFKNLGVDGIMFQCIQYPFGLSIPQGWYKSFENFPRSEIDIQNAVNYLISQKKRDGFLMNSMEEIKLWREYFKNPEYLNMNLNPCKSYEQNLIVDVCGNVKFCFNKVLEQPNKIGNILITPLDELWNGKSALQIKEEMKYCTRSCGIMACHIDSNLREKQ